MCESNYLAWASKWEWEIVQQRSARKGTEFQFIPPGCQFCNGLAENRVKIIKQTLAHTMTGTTINNKLTVTYAEMQTFLLRATYIMNDRPIGVRHLTNDVLSPLTPNQLLLGQTIDVPSTSPIDEEEFEARAKYQEEILTSWWN